MTESGLVREVTPASLEDELRARSVFVVDFWAEWCAPCVAVSRTIEEIATELEGRVAFGKLDVEAHPEVAEKYGVASVPTIVVFVGGVPVRRVRGTRPKRHLLREIHELLDSPGDGDGN